MLRSLQSYVGRLEGRVTDLTGLLSRAVGEFQELRLRNEGLGRELGEARAYIKKLEGHVTAEIQQQLQVCVLGGGGGL